MHIFRFSHRTAFGALALPRCAGQMGLRVLSAQRPPDGDSVADRRLTQTLMTVVERTVEVDVGLDMIFWSCSKWKENAREAKGGIRRCEGCSLAFLLCNGCIV